VPHRIDPPDLTGQRSQARADLEFVFFELRRIGVIMTATL
jgi:hypothetical protein